MPCDKCGYPFADDDCPVCTLREWVERNKDTMDSLVEYLNVIVENMEIQNSEIARWIEPLFDPWGGLDV